ncbi:hypothetical protein B0J14DRAFT_588257 [Halenospora varia]|nr:hypothetical protein B0J14DRAFT_588257 [Halenospora varia]
MLQTLLQPLLLVDVGQAWFCGPLKRAVPFSLKYSIDRTRRDRLLARSCCNFSCNANTRPLSYRRVLSNYLNDMIDQSSGNFGPPKTNSIVNMPSLNEITCSPATGNGLRSQFV